MTFGMFGLLFLLPLAWQSAGRFDAMEAGIALMPMAIVLLVVSPFSGALARRYGVQVVSAGGVAVTGAGLLLIGASSHPASLILTEIGLALTGLGTGIATGPLMGTAIGTVSPARSGTVSALVNVARMGGATIGIATLGTVFAATQGGYRGLQAALLLASAFQLICAGMTWRLLQPDR